MNINLLSLARCVSLSLTLIGCASTTQIAPLPPIPIAPPSPVAPPPPEIFPASPPPPSSPVTDAPPAIVTETVAPSIPSEESVFYPVWYATNQFPKSNKQDCDTDFERQQGKFRGEHVVYGKCIVMIPKKHLIGSVKGFSMKGSQSVAFKGDFEEFWVDVGEYTKKESSKSILVFVHGFNVTFEDAIARAAQLGVDLFGPNSTTLAYTWPNSEKDGSRNPIKLLNGYLTDEANIEASEDYIGEFLMAVAQKARYDGVTVHVIAHSMGNRGVLRGLERAYLKSSKLQQSTLQFGQIILASPDVDADLFRRLSWIYPKLAKRTTIYNSSQDKAVQLSAWLHAAPRAGFFPPPFFAPNIDTISTAGIKDHWLIHDSADRWIGHSSYSSNTEVIADIREIIKDASTDKRALHKCDPGVFEFNYSPGSTETNDDTKCLSLRKPGSVQLP